MELRSPVFAAEVASRARSPQVVRPRNKTDHVTDILTLERPGEVVPQVRSGGVWRWRGVHGALGKGSIDQSRFKLLLSCVASSTPASCVRVS